MAANDPRQSCPLCGAGTLLDVAEFSALHRVTSDARPWPASGRLAQCDNCGAVQKPADQEFLRETQAIYSSYQLYYQGSGNEHRVFNNNQHSPRSNLLLSYFFQYNENIDETSQIRWLDFGCGPGHLLGSLSTLRPSWRLTGADLGEENRQRIESIPGVERYIAGGLKGVDGAYDVISLSHVLEHVPDPGSLLAGLQERLLGGGYLLIAVPDWQTNPFDLLVADHCHHFQLGQLCRLMEDSGFSVVAASDQAITKELLVVARVDEPATRGALGVGLMRQPAETVRWLANLIPWAERTGDHRATGVFGTALAATWLDDSVSQPFDFFVDENPDRIGTVHRGRPVLAPNQVSADSIVHIPMPPSIASSVARRLEQDGTSRFLVPPPLPE